MNLPARSASLGEELAREALATVLGADAVLALRSDSPLALADGDLVALADAVEGAAARFGATCVLSEADLASTEPGPLGPEGVRTLAHLRAAIDTRLVQGTP